MLKQGVPGEVKYLNHCMLSCPSFPNRNSPKQLEESESEFSALLRYFQSRFMFLQLWPALPLHQRTT